MDSRRRTEQTGGASDEKGPGMEVICAVDGSSAATGVARYAAGVASRIGVGLRIVRAVQVADPLYVTAGVVRAMDDPADRREQVLGRAQRQLDELCAGVDGVEATPELRQGAADAEVFEAVAEHDAPLIVIGTSARSGLRRALGGVAQRIIRRAPCPVLVVPHGYDRGLRERPTILVGLRGGDRDDAAAALRQAERLAELMRAELVVAHAQRDAADSGADAGLAELAEGRRHVASRGNPAQELLRIAADMDADAIAVAPRGHGPLRQALLGSVSSGLLSAGERPVFVIPRTH